MHTVQLGANCLPGTECQAWNEINAAITAEDFVMLVRGAEPMEKRLRRGLIASLLSFFLASPRKFPPRL